jgi:VIT1/CCC1 family predicted Fe2+/Mn2+ transporter
MHEVRPALRLSNAIAVTMLLLLGRAFARYTGGSPWVVGVGMLVVGGTMVALTIALGG